MTENQASPQLNSPTKPSIEGSTPSAAINAERVTSTAQRRSTATTLRMVVNLLIGAPFLAAGVFGIASEDLSKEASLALALVGVLVVLIGVYVTVLSRPRLNLMAGEETLVLRHPSMRPAFARIVMSLPFLAAAGYLLEFTTLPYVYPFAPFIIAVYFYFRGVITYWMNHHTTYYVTNRRAVQMYRFIWLDTTEIPVASINSISETRSFVEVLSGRGSVVVASGIGARHKVRIQEIDNPGPVAEVLRGLMP